MHIPKCGGTSIEHLIWPGQRSESDLWMGFISPYHNKYQTGGLQHLFAQHIRKEVGSEIFASYFKFAIVRNPWDRAVSQYVSMRYKPHLMAFVGMRPEDSFRTYLDLIKKRTHVQWEHQHKFVLDKHGNLLVDHLGRFENFEHDVAQILARLGIHAAIPHLNAAQDGAKIPVYDEEAVDTVAELYRQDIEVFGYAGCAPAVR